MAFKKRTARPSVAESPDKLLMDLTRREVLNVFPPQEYVLQKYVEHEEASDVALQLPTGSGKTLVGLLIAEWRRRKNNERVVYLCPTIQLVEQVVEQAQTKYGLQVVGFTGSHHNYSPSSKAAYQNAKNVAITTYSSLFNTSPFFNNADVVIIDDAHASENYITSMWSLEISKNNADQKAAFEAISSLIRPYIEHVLYQRLIDDSNTNEGGDWVEKISTPDYLEIADGLACVLEANAEVKGIKFPWKLLRENLSCCHLYVSQNKFLIKPFISPTWTHEPFSTPKQRIYMSATLSQGGDLERMTGRAKITKIPLPKDLEAHGVGRRFFIFPEMSLMENEIISLRDKLINSTDKAVIITQSDTAEEKIKSQLSEKHPDYVVTDASSIKTFFESTKAIAVLANRYDGIDFPEASCRLLFIEGLQKATNLQEQFLMNRIGTLTLFRERIQTRVLQAIGRATRSFKDYSAVIATGENVTSYLSDKDKYKYFFPELQAEIDYGVYQSSETSVDEITENFQMFLENGTDWDEQNQEIVESRSNFSKAPFDCIEELAEVVPIEIQYQKHIWQRDFQSAYQACETAISKLRGEDLKPYRALWHYLAGSAAAMDYTLSSSQSILKDKIRIQFTSAKRAAKCVPWLAKLSSYETQSSNASPTEDKNYLYQVENIEKIFSKLGNTHSLLYAKKEEEIISGLNDKDKFEQAHLQLGRLLGFDVGKVEADGSPDPWWRGSNFCIVFEDHYGDPDKPTDILSTHKARQTDSHTKWIRHHLNLPDDFEIIPVLVSNVSNPSTGSIPLLEEFYFWKLDDFKHWATECLSGIRDIKSSFTEIGNIAWREAIFEKMEQHQIVSHKIRDKAKSRKASDLNKL